LYCTPFPKNCGFVKSVRVSLHVRFSVIREILFGNFVRIVLIVRKFSVEVCKVGLCLVREFRLDLKSYCKIRDF